MIHVKKLVSIIALLLFVVSAVWAQTYDNTVNINETNVPTVPSGQHWLITGTGVLTTRGITISDGGTVTLSGVYINKEQAACIKCLGSATIILADGTTNKLESAGKYPAIQIGDQGTTLTIQGSTGVLYATTTSFSRAGIGGGSNNTNYQCGDIVIQGGIIYATGGTYSPGIGADYGNTCGNITITGGTVTATGDQGAAGIGSGSYATCGNITITGGTVTATGGNSAAGIGGSGIATCGNITIAAATAVTKVTATKGLNAPYSIGGGVGNDATCGTVIVGGEEGAIETSPYTYTGVPVSPTGNVNEWIFTMPTDNVEVVILFKPLAQIVVTFDDEEIPSTGLTGFIGQEQKFIGKLAATVTDVDNPTLTYESSNPAVIAFGTNNETSGALSDIKFLQVGSAMLTVKFDGNDDYSQSQVSFLVNVDEKTYTMTLDDGDSDSDHWKGKAGDATIYSGFPLEGVKPAQTVTVKYEGSRRVKSVTAEVQVPIVDLSAITSDTTIADGYTLTGTLTANVKISIAKGATVTLDGVTINGVNVNSYAWAGLNCLGSASIILKDETTNTLRGFYKNYPGIHVPTGRTLTITGTGSLNASSNGSGAGIGGGYGLTCGSIVISGGTINATGGQYAAGIGSGINGACGNIVISGGGTINATGGQYAAGIGSGYYGTCGNVVISGGGTINATGGQSAAGIGSGYYGTCGNITINPETAVTTVMATKGASAPNSIGSGKSGSCGKVKIGGQETGNITQSPYTYTPGN